MDVPMELTFRDVERTPELDRIIDDKVAGLMKVCPHLISCRLTIEQPQKHQRTGNPYQVRIMMRVPPGNEVIVHRLAGEGEMHEPLTSVLRKTFDRARQRLADQMDIQRGDVKEHPEQALQAFVVRMMPQKDCGFLKTPDGQEIYFHRNSVLHEDFDRLTIGTGVRFSLEMGDEGPQASSVQVVSKPGVRAEQSAPIPERP